MSSGNETSVEEPHSFECISTVTLRSYTPVVGIEFNPRVSLRRFDCRPPPEHTFRYTWHRKQTSSSSGQDQVCCYVHPDKLATVQCISCVELKLPVEESYCCSNSCFEKEWKKHMVSHQHAAKAVSTDNKRVGRELRSCGSWHEDRAILEQEENEWIEVGCLKSYVPTLIDLGSILRLQSVAVDPLTGAQLAAINTIETNPVITAPLSQLRCMIKCSLNGPNFRLGNHSSNDVTFSVLSYNVLADLYITSGSQSYDYCPTWALVWEYRRHKILHEIIGYDADILCLQEVQSNHFEEFFKPKLTKCGYAVMYKQKTMDPLYVDEKYISEGCATFYRCKLFKEMTKHELEFSKMAAPFIQALGHHAEGSYRLGKNNIALIAMLRILDNENGGNLLQSIVCVANTHISANKDFPDVKLFQIVSLVNRLEEITRYQVPLVICGDFNSLPLSDPHRFIVSGRCNPPNKQEDPFGISKYIKLHHSFPLASAYSSFSVSDSIEERLRMMNAEANEPLFTNITSKFSGTLDYIFYTANSLRVEGLLDLLECEGLRPGLPTPIWPSDHIALMARFRLLNPLPRPGQSSTKVTIRHPHPSDAKKEKQVGRNNSSINMKRLEKLSLG